MKRIFILLLAVFPVRLFASTNVSGNVSGTWTLAGSPYLVTNNLNVPGGATLRIHPGVEVIFQGFFNLNVEGTLIATGTQAAPVQFKMNDTTGWYNDLQMAGGWRGIQFQAFAGIYDSSALNYCKIQDAKHGLNGNANGKNPLAVNGRSLKVSNCELFHNQSAANQSDGKIVSVYLSAGQLFEMTDCRVHDNKSRVASIFLYGGKSVLSNNEVHHNNGGGTLWGLNGQATLSLNNFHHNTNMYDLATIKIDGGKNMIRNNTIHHNESDRMGAITCSNGKTTIEANLICNNYTLNGNCGATDGGGALHLSSNGGVYDSTEYLVRNNVMANNYCAYYGGGVYVYDCKVNIVNNHIINNSAYYGGPAVYVIGVQSKVLLKNNIFFGNTATLGGAVMDVQLLSANTLNYDYNWSEYPFYLTVSMNLPVPNIGDTTHNVTGSNPYLAQPTISSNYLEDALQSNFNLTANSLSCINTGDTAGAFMAATDYAGNSRFQGNNIEIGAFETNKSTPEHIAEPESILVGFAPNPFYESFEITLKRNDNYNIQISDMFGKILFEKQFSGMKSTFYLDHFAAGNYVLTVLTGQQIITTLKISKY